MYSTNGAVNSSQDVLMIALFISIVLFVFMIYVGICVIIIKNDLKKLVNYELEKRGKEKDQEDISTNSEKE